MADFFDYIVDTLRLLGGLRTGTATGGGATGLIDTTNRTEPDDYWNGGTIFILSASGAAPEGDMLTVTDFVNSSSEIETAGFSAGVQVDDRYAVAEAHYPLDALMDAVNLAIKQHRYIYEDQSLTVVADQTEYDLPSGVQMGRINEVYVQTNVDSNDNRWRKVGEWWTHDDGTDQKLIIPQGLTASRTLRIDYQIIHTDFDAGDDAIYDILEPKYVIYRAAEFMLLYQMHDGDEWPHLEERINYFMAKADAYEQEFKEKHRYHRRE
jgi:hypothetical protein